MNPKTEVKMEKLVILFTAILSIAFICPAQDESIYTSDFHKKVAPKIVFFKTPLAAGKETDENVCSSFTSSDNIYGRALLNKTLGTISEELGGGEYNYGFRMYFDKDPQVGDNWKKPDAEFLDFVYDFNLETRSTTRIDIIAAPGEASNESMANIFKSKFGSLTQGKHTVYFYMLAKKEKIYDLAFGSFEINWSSSVADDQKTKVNESEKKGNTGNFKLIDEYEKEDNWFVKGMDEDNEVLFCRAIGECVDKVNDQMKSFVSAGGIIEPDETDVAWFYKAMKKLEVAKMKYWAEKARTVKKWTLAPDDLHNQQDNANWYVNKLPAIFDKSVKDNKLANNINAIIEKGDEDLKAGKNNEAILHMKAAKLLCDAIFLISPNQADLKPLADDAQKYLDKFNAEKEKVYTGPLHKKYLTKIIFSKAPIKVKQENESSFATEFTGNDNIYAIAYADGTFGELLDNSNISSIGVHVFIDGNEASETSAISECILKFLPKDLSKKSYLEFDILPDVTIATYPDAAKTIAKILGKVSSRSHTVKIQLSNKAGIAEGEFKIDLSQGQDKIKANEKLYTEKAIDLVRMPQTDTHDANLEAQIKAALSIDQEFKNAGVTPLRVVIFGSWYDQKDDWGSLKFKECETYVAVKRKDGRCELLHVFVARDNIGGGKLGKIRYESAGWSAENFMRCENVSK
jgi:hypothetical protein